VSKKLPSVTSDIPRDLRTFIDRIREIVTGSGNDRLISAQDLIDGGIASAGNNGTLTTPTTGVIGTPPAPANLSVTAGVNDLFVEWDNPTYFGHDYTEVFSGATNVIGDAVLLGFTPGINYVDTIGPQQARYYWARFVNRLGVKGPFNSVTGTLGTTLPEVDHLLEVLTGEITETQLFTDLGARVDLVDRTNGGLTNKYTVKIDSNGYVSGFGLAYTANNATPFSDFIIRADRFSIASPSGPGLTPIVPFIVTTTSSVIDGTTVPAGVYINGAYIKGGTIKGSAIEGGTITNSKLINVSANKITGAALEATSYIESAAYIAGSQGWKIHANGTAEFGAASIRGQVTAAQIDSRGLSIKDSSGNIILAAGTALSYTNISPDSGWLNSNLVPSITNAQNTANSASSTANTANSTANTANSTANTALSTANSKLSRAGDTVTGRITFSVADGMFAGSDTNNGVYFGSTGLLGRKNGSTTFYINTAGDAVFGGQLVVGGSPGISGTNMTGNGALINPTGTFAIGNSTTNVTFNGDVLKLNGNVVGIENMKPGATLPDYCRTYKGSTTLNVPYGNFPNPPWLPLVMDGSALLNTIGAIDYDSRRVYLPAGTYYYELSVPVKCNGSDTNNGCYTAIALYPPGTTYYQYEGEDDYGSVYSGTQLSILDTAGANILGDWQCATIYGVGRFTLPSANYVTPVIFTNDFPSLTISAKGGYSTMIWKIYRSA
jgi:hypothetical protein